MKVDRYLHQCISFPKVHWVQCDGCELWFHLYCIGLKPEQVSEDEDFICKACKPNKNNKVHRCLNLTC